MLNSRHLSRRLTMRESRGGFSIVELLVIVAILVALAAFILPLRRSAGGAARRAQCQNNVKQITTALHNYAAEHGTFPPAFTVGPNGQRFHSWRVLILPYFDQRNLYSQVDLSKPWNDPVNSEAAKSIVTAFTCPESESTISQTYTPYLAITSPDGCFDGPKARTLIELPAEARRTMMVVDAGADHTVHWMSPDDINLSQLFEIATEVSRTHLGVLIIGFADGSARQVFPDVINRATAIAGDVQ
jgi:type II secretory pathway pseudopilin PulG